MWPIVLSPLIQFRPLENKLVREVHLKLLVCAPFYLLHITKRRIKNIYEMLYCMQHFFFLLLFTFLHHSLFLKDGITPLLIICCCKFILFFYYTHFVTCNSRTSILYYLTSILLSSFHYCSVW
jgi:hypothetical protein